ncbi:unnamed protein product [Rotaria sp. Silwood2]|nr:unnamed protein product [Rotaria sp. Silwood2]CAF4174456.1 unnamed protein product [Rotaria sp. Silwood2]
MMNSICHSSSPIDVNIENPSLNDHQSSINENDSIQQVLQNDENKPRSSYIKLSVDENRNLGLSEFQDPLFYEQPLDFHYNRLMPTIITSEYETGDQIRLANDIKLSKNEKQNSLSSHRHEIDKSRTTYRQHSKSKKSKNKITKMTEKKKKTSIDNLYKSKRKSKKINRNRFERFQYEPKNRQKLFLKHHHKQQELFLNKKKKLLKQRITSKKESMLKMNKNKPLKSVQHNRRFNMTNNRINSAILSNRSLTSGSRKIHSIPRLKTKITRNQHLSQSNKNRISSISRLADNPKTRIIANKIKSQADLSTLNSVLQSNSQQMMKVTSKDKIQTPTNTLSSSCAHSTHSSKTCLSTERNKKLSKTKLHRSRSNVRKLTASKSKQIKKRNRACAKLHICSPTNTKVSKNIRHYRKCESAKHKTKFPRCQSKTLIRIAPINKNDQNLTKSFETNKDNIQMKMKPSIFSSKNSLTDKVSSTSTIMPLTKNNAQLTSKNNNRRASKIKRRRNSSTSTKLEKKLMRSTRTGMVLRSKTIIINSNNSTERKK